MSGGRGASPRAGMPAPSSSRDRLPPPLCLASLAALCIKDEKNLH